jgi:hypothetical protein
VTNYDRIPGLQDDCAGQHVREAEAAPFPARRDPLPPAPPSSQEWLTAPEAAAHLRLPSAKALYQRVARGQVEPHRLGRRLRFRRAGLDALLLRSR